MLENANGKLLVYTSRFRTSGSRLQSINVAAEKMAKSLKLSMEVVKIGEKNAPVYVYYKNGEEEAIPIYCDKGGNSKTDEVCTVLRNMMFVLSFHPKHSALRHVRKEIMQFS
jgi:hypothetical protein